VVEGATAELELESVDEPTCRRPKAVASAKCVQRRIYIKGSVRLTIGRMMGLRQMMPSPPIHKTAKGLCLCVKCYKDKGKEANWLDPDRIGTRAPSDSTTPTLEAAPDH
jgi:hypothetical protein